MTSQALYNRWRGQTFDDILGQEHITATLRNQIRVGRIGHAYLFTGVRGTGKTSTARILAKAVNCVGDTDAPPCNECHICRTITTGRSLDLIEIDAASNRGIDEIRELRERVSFVPQETRYKVYVIDEVHMLTKEAFNALLKTLEEPPEHVIFVLCTTEAYRLPDTILSRCQRYDFRRATVQTVAVKLQRICAAEGIEITPEALDYVARRGAGSFRDAESLLDQVAAYADSVIDLEFVQRALGVVPAEAITRLISTMLHGDAAEGLTIINSAMDQGADPRQFLSEILEQLRAILLLGVGSQEQLVALGPETIVSLRSLLREEGFSGPLLLKAIRTFQTAGQELRNAVHPQLPLELALVETVLAQSKSDPMPMQPASLDSGQRRTTPGESAAPTAGQPAPLAKSTAPKGRQASPGADRADAPTAKPSPEAALEQPNRVPAPVESEPGEETADETETSASPPMTLEWVRAKWGQVVNRTAAHHPSLQGLLTDAYPVRVRDDVIRVACATSFKCDTLADAKRSAQVEGIMQQVLGAPCRIECVVGSPEERQSATTDADPRDEHLFSRAERQEGREQALRNHPAVRALEQRGAKVTRVELDDSDE